MAHAHMRSQADAYPLKHACGDREEVMGIGLSDLVPGEWCHLTKFVAAHPCPCRVLAHT
jgi:hypothetical protein